MINMMNAMVALALGGEVPKVWAIRSNAFQEAIGGHCEHFMRLYQWIAHAMGVMIVVYEKNRYGYATTTRMGSTGQKYLFKEEFPHTVAQAVNEWSSSRLFPPSW